MTLAVPASRPATAPQGNVMQASHRYVAQQNHPSLDATNTLNVGEAEQ
jgi:hypothetical protein